MDVIGRQDAADDIDAFLAAELTADVADAQPDLTRQHLMAVLGQPDDVIAMIENTVAASVLVHVLTLWKMSRSRVEGSFSRG